MCDVWSAFSGLICFRGKKGATTEVLDEDLLNWVFSLKYPLNLITKEDLDLLVNKWQMIKNN